MARTGSQENKTANTTDAAAAAAANQTAQTAVGQANKNIATLNAGQPVAANPWMNPGYLGNVNRLQSGALNAETNAGTQQLQLNNRRTGGLNTGATTGAIRDLSLNKMRLADQLGAERSASDWTKNIAYQQQQALAPLNIAQAESPFYGSSLSGQGQALGNLTQLGIASYGPWNSAIQGIGGAAGAYFGK